MFKNHSLLFYGIILPAIALAVYAPFSASIDLWLSGYFYQTRHFHSNPFLDWVYHYAIIPGWILTGFAGFSLIYSFFNSHFKRRQKAFLLILLTLAIGSGLIVHLALKEQWGRPRPRQTIEFGGNQPFQAFYAPNSGKQPEPSKSFSCGHCTMGFCFFSLMFIGIGYRKKSLFYIGLFLSLTLGGLLGYARIAQGGHFLSDVIVSALIMWWTALLLYDQLFRKKIPSNTVN